MTWRSLAIGTLISLIVVLSLPGVVPAPATACLTGLGPAAAPWAAPGPAVGRGPAANPGPTVDPGSTACIGPAPVSAASVSAGSTPTEPPATARAATPSRTAIPVQAAAASKAPNPSQAGPPSTGQSSGSGPAGAFNYTVAPGDDLNRLASRFRTKAAAIAAASGIPVGQTLYPGMVLRVPTTDPARVEPPLKAEAVPWDEVDALWAVGTVAQVTDIETGNVFYVMRRGGWAHADVEPVSAEDTATILSDYGGHYSWARRSVVVVVAGRRIAASQNFMPHGRKSLASNDFPGHFCIHFLGSTTHGSVYTSNGVPTLDPEHQRHVLQAVGH